ncbi:MAG TPA: histidinol-phosphate transaminase [Dehalococcoidia bacterium]|nr:histidinol-phosphate transaminase [Chloroflexota bacterium]HCE77113.1 histidinol-phosphate transaminase [Dehalococcoidia bacterium]|tara:strand:- start:480 stop:1568 length:1089 start_codon:yes stop_codon:yes gene_type:complete
MGKIDIEKIIRPHLVNVKTYDAMEAPETLARKSGIPESEIIKLNGNENPYGGSQKAIDAVANTPLHIYPDPNQTNMRMALSRYTGMSPENIVVGSGADELIDLIFRLFISEGDKILDCEPTFGMYSFCARIAGGAVNLVQRDEIFDIDVSAVINGIDEVTKVIFITSPNNPTGNIATESQISELLETGLLVVVDEAYYEFSGRTVQNLVSENENLIVLRTMSKWAGLAGLRVGYGIMHKKLANFFMDVKPPYNVNIAAEAALIASLDDVDYLLGNVNKIITERDRMFELINALPSVKAWPSHGNYLMCEFQKNEAERIYVELATQGIFVRNFNSPRLRDCFRIAVGTSSDTDNLIAAMKAIV